MHKRLMGYDELPAFEFEVDLVGLQPFEDIF